MAEIFDCDKKSRVWLEIMKDVMQRFLTSNLRDCFAEGMMKKEKL